MPTQYVDAYNTMMLILYTDRPNRRHSFSTSDPVPLKVHEHYIQFGTYLLPVMMNRDQTPAVVYRSQNLCGMEGVGVEIHEAAMNS